MPGDVIMCSQVDQDNWQIEYAVAKSTNDKNKSYNERTANTKSTAGMKNEHRGQPWGDGSFGDKKDGQPVNLLEHYQSKTTEDAFKYRKGGENLGADGWEEAMKKMQGPPEYDMQTGPIKPFTV